MGGEWKSVGYPSSRHLPSLAQINQLISPDALYRSKLLHRTIHCTILYCCPTQLPWICFLGKYCSHQQLQSMLREMCSPILMPRHVWISFPFSLSTYYELACKQVAFTPYSQIRSLSRNRNFHWLSDRAEILIHSNSRWTACVLPQIHFSLSQSIRSAHAMSNTVAQKSLWMLSKVSIWVDKHRIYLQKSAARSHGLQSTEGNRKISRF